MKPEPTLIRLGHEDRYLGKATYEVSPEKKEYVPGERFYPKADDKAECQRPIRYVVAVITSRGEIGALFGPTVTEIECLDYRPTIPESNDIEVCIVRFDHDGKQLTLWKWRRVRWERLLSPCPPRDAATTQTQKAQRRS